MAVINIDGNGNVRPRQARERRGGPVFWNSLGKSSWLVDFGADSPLDRPGLTHVPAGGTSARRAVREDADFGAYGYAVLPAAKSATTQDDGTEERSHGTLAGPELIVEGGGLTGPLLVLGGLAVIGGAILLVRWYRQSKPLAP